MLRTDIYLVTYCCSAPLFAITNHLLLMNCENDKLIDRNGEAGVTNKISIGWHVSPRLYGDTGTHIYSYWTSDNSKSTGCYNTLCRGFVQTNSEYIIGVRVAETSVYGGAMYEIKVDILKDRQTKNWLVNIEDQTIGYFPAALFNDLDAAAQVGWGGRTMTPAGTPNPPMGSGYLPDNFFDHACYFRQVSYRDKSLSTTIPTADVIETFTDAPKCYGVDNYDTRNIELFGYNVHIGGPGGVC
ncbi:hypothetical protein QL285_027685 [Trifolium repens]|nr:hypothetical protein QL285_027685 [Trifolium repens]